MLWGTGRVPHKPARRWEMAKDTLIPCSFCPEVLPFNKMAKHGWDAHPQEMRERLRRATETSRLKRISQLSQPPEKSPKPQGGGDVVVGEKGVVGERVKLKGQFVARTVTLDARLLILYDAFRARFPDTEMDEGQWVYECVTRYCFEHGQEIGLAEQMKQMVEA